MNRYKTDYEDSVFRKIAYNIRKGSYQYIGKGSGRVVFDLGDGRVVKAARNIRGIAQNFEEFRIALANDSGLFARIWNVSEDYRLLIMDKAERISDISLVWDYFQVGSNIELYQASGLRDIADKYSLLINDFGRAVNWGEIDGRPVIVDYGFTRQVRKRFYVSRT